MDERIWKRRYMPVHTHTCMCTHACTYMHTHVRAMEYYATIKRKGLLSFAITWINCVERCAKSDRERKIPHDLSYR